MRRHSEKSLPRKYKLHKKLRLFEIQVDDEVLVGSSSLETEPKAEDFREG
jgi:hypothetical protein